MSDLLKKALKKNAIQNPWNESPSGSEEEQEEVAELGDDALNKKKSKSPIDSQKFLPLLEYIADIPVYFSNSEKKLIFLGVHGAGLSAASFAPLAEKVKPFASFAAFDFPKHGLNKNYTDDADLSIENLSRTTMMVASFLIDRFPDCAIVLLGHSVGGAVAANVAHLLQTSPQLEFPFVKRQIVGLLVIDVVEGSAVFALPLMRGFVMGRPTKFKSLEDAINYHLKAKLINNSESARVTVPSLFEKKDNVWVWKTDLLFTEKYWNDWFKGLNAHFLESHLPKMLILADADRMDKELTIAQMQGKFKLVCFKTFVGHCVHEDDPQQMADNLKEYLKLFHVPLSMEDIERIEKVGVTKFRNGM
jgi:protein phosphatase methylesterase 1